MKRYLLVGGMCLFVLWGGLVACQEEPGLTPEPATATLVPQTSPVAAANLIATADALISPSPTLTTISAITENFPIEPPPVTLFLYDTIIPDLASWQVTQEYLFNNYGENLFLQLTNFNPQTQAVLPEVAITWTVNAIATVYTFTLKTDIPWVYYLPPTGETIQEVDREGNPRFVVAEDFVYGIQYFCHPTNAVYESFAIISPTIKGCAAVLNNTLIPTPPELLDAIGVRAPAPDTLVIELTEPTGYFPIFTSLPVFSALPRWTIETYGDKWLEAGTIVTNGRFVLTEWVHNVRIELHWNLRMPDDMQGTGNIKHIYTIVGPNMEVGYELWRNNQVDSAVVPDGELISHQEEFSEESLFSTNPTISYLAIRMTKPPFDDVRVRRAFSAAIDREALVNEFFPGQAMAMRHFTPPDLWGAPLPNEIGVGFDPEYAREQLAAAGHSNCIGLPTIKIFPGGPVSGLNVVEYLQQEWSKNLDCPLIQFQPIHCGITDSEDACQYDSTTPDETAPHIVFQGWGAYYADTFSALGDYLGCEQLAYMHRPCTEVDEWLAAARATPDLTQRTALYHQIEEALFGPNGEFPVIPLFVRLTPYAQHRWLTTTPFLPSGAPWYDWAIDVEAQQEARSSP